jgi:hypothetical protein
MEAKQVVRALLDKLPDDCTLEEEAGLLVPHEEVERELRQRWLLGDS